MMDTGKVPTRSPWIPYCLAIAMVVAVAPPVFVACRAFGLAPLLGGIVTAALVAILLAVARRGISSTLVGAARSKPALFGLWFLLFLFAGYRMGGLSVFMLDVEQTSYAFQRTIRTFDDPKLAKPFFLKHNCFTCYMVASHLASKRVDNIYDSKYYRDAEEPTPIHETINDKLDIDRYQYPPPFLVLPRALQALGGDFFTWRSIWFAFNLLAFTATVGALALWLRADGFSAAWFIWPAVLAAPCAIGALQIENAHVLIITLSVGGMLAFEMKRTWLGALLLGFTVVAKIFPGVLLVYLALRGKWRAVLWTVGAMTAYVLVAIGLFGLKPFESFIHYQIPRLASGEAFGFAWEYIHPIIVNSSAMGVAYKLDKLGLGVDPAGLAKVLVWMHTALLLIVLVVAGWKRRRVFTDDSSQEQSNGLRLNVVRVWLVLLILGQMRSPFLPWTYGNVAVLWLLALLIPNEGKQWIKMVLLGTVWCVYATTVPLPFGPGGITLDLVYVLGATCGVLFLCASLVFLQARAGADGASSPMRPLKSS